jgi:hypothetical protein
MSKQHEWLLLIYKVPTVTVRWQDVSTYGAHWLVPSGFAPGQSMILTLTGAAGSNYPA